MLLYERFALYVKLANQSHELKTNYATKPKPPQGRAVKKSATPPLPDGARSGLEFHKAGQRLMAQRGQYGGARPCALVWAIQFAQEDLKALAAGGLSDRLEEMKRFSVDAGIGEAFEQGNARDSLLMMNTTVDAQLSPTALPLNVLLRMQDEVRAVLADYVSGQLGIKVPLSVSYEVTRDIHTPNSGRVLLHLLDMRQGVFLHLFHLLAELGARIKPCRYDGTLFLAGRTDKQFCSGLCQAMQYKKDHPKDKHFVTRRTKGGSHGSKR